MGRGFVTTAVLWAVVVAPASSQDTAPIDSAQLFEVTLEGVRHVVLPPHVVGAIDAAFPEFTPWFGANPSVQDEFVSVEAKGAVVSRSAVIGDFDGDGRSDVAVDGYTRTEALLVAHLARGGKPIVLAVTRNSLQRGSFRSANGALRPLTEIRPLPPGEYESDCHGPDEPRDQWSIKLENDGINWGWDDKMALLFYYLDGEFREFPLAVC